MNCSGNELGTSLRTRNFRCIYTYSYTWLILSFCSRSHSTPTWLLGYYIFVVFFFYFCFLLLMVILSIFLYALYCLNFMYVSSSVYVVVVGRLWYLYAKPMQPHYSKKKKNSDNTQNKSKTTYFSNRTVFLHSFIMALNFVFIFQSFDFYLALFFGFFFIMCLQCEFFLFCALYVCCWLVVVARKTCSAWAPAFKTHRLYV